MILIFSKSERCIFKNEVFTLFLANYIHGSLIVEDDEELFDIFTQKLVINFEMVSCRNPTSYLALPKKNDFSFSTSTDDNSLNKGFRE